MAANIYDWDVVAANNATADTDLTWAEGQAPSTVNNSARVMMQRGKQLLIDLGGSLSAGGTANALTLTAQSPFTSLANGRIVSFKATATNTGAATINVNAIGAKAIVKMTSSGEKALSGGEIQNTGMFTLQYSTALASGAGAWVLTNPAVVIGDSVLETGSVSAAASKEFILTPYQALGFSRFELEISSWAPVTDSVALLMTVSTDSGASYFSTAYSYCFTNGIVGNTTQAIGDVNGPNFAFWSTQGNSVGEIGNTIITMAPLSTRFFYSSRGMFWNSAGAIAVNSSSGQRFTGGVNAVKLAYSSGNISAGDYVLRGY